MKNLFGLIFIVLFVCCISNAKKRVESKTSDYTFSSPSYEVAEVTCKEDSFVKVLLNNGIKTVKDRMLLISENNIKYTSGYSNDFSFAHYKLSYKENTIEFVDTIYEKRKIDKRNLYLNKMQLNVCKIKNNVFDIDSMELHVVYTESEIYTFENSPSYLLVVSHPMNWVGTMTRFSFFQLINLKEKTVVEFIKEEE